MATLARLQAEIAAFTADVAGAPASPPLNGSMAFRPGAGAIESAAAFSDNASSSLAVTPACCGLKKPGCRPLTTLLLEGSSMALINATRAVVKFCRIGEPGAVRLTTAI